MSFDNTTSELYNHLEDCALETGTISQIGEYFNYTFIQQNTTLNTTDFNNNYALFGPLSYTFTTIGDTIYLHITNSIGEIATFSANNLRTDTFLEQAISIYPNPVYDVLNVNALLHIQNLKLYSLNGHFIELDYSQNEYKINTSDLQTGVYFLKMDTSLGSITKKIVKK